MKLLSRAEYELVTLVGLLDAGVPEAFARRYQEARWPLSAVDAIEELSARGLLISMDDLIAWIRETVAQADHWPDGEPLDSGAIELEPEALDDLAQWCITAERGKPTQFAIIDEVDPTFFQRIEARLKALRALAAIDPSASVPTAAVFIERDTLLAALDSNDPETFRTAARIVAYNVAVGEIRLPDEIAPEVRRILTFALEGDPAACDQLRSWLTIGQGAELVGANGGEPSIDETRAALRSADRRIQWRAAITLLRRAARGIAQTHKRSDRKRFEGELIELVNRGLDGDTAAWDEIDRRVGDFREFCESLAPRESSVPLLDSNLTRFRLPAPPGPRPEPSDLPEKEPA